MKSYVAIFITIVLFSTIEVETKLINGNIDSIFLSFLRFFISGLIMAAIGFNSIKKIEKRDILPIVIYGFVGVTIALGAYHISLNYIDASKGAVIFSINPVFSALFAVFLVGEKLNLQKIIGVVLGFVGVWILSFGYSLPAFSNIAGPGLMLIAAIGFAFYIVGLKPYVKKYGSFAVVGAAFTAGSVLYLPFIRTFEIKQFGYSWPHLLYLSVIATGIAYILYFYGLKNVTVVAGTSMFYIKPVLASILSVMILHENLKPEFYSGLAVIFIALTVTITNFGRIIRRR